MAKATVYKPNPKLDLVLERVIDISPKLVWEAWTTPKHIKKWFTPAPWKTIDCKIDLRPGGRFSTVMKSPEGQEIHGNGCILEVVENKKLVWTDCLQPNFRPSENPFFTGMIILEAQGKKTKYKAIAIHKDEATRKKHDEMGFHTGWGMALDQLVAHMKR